MPELTNWMMAFLRVSAMLAVFPVFSARNFPVQLRLALGAVMAWMAASTLPPMLSQVADLWSLTGTMIMEVGIGLLFGFASRMIFFALEMAGGIITTEIGLSLQPIFNPMSETQLGAPASILYYLAAMLWLSLDMHHWMLAGFQKTYIYLPAGGAHLTEALTRDIIARTSECFLITLQLTAPIIAVSFIISLVFAVLGRAVPQMNVFAESFFVRTMVGLTVFGLTMQLMSQHIINYLRRLPEDIFRVAQLMGSA